MLRLKERENDKLLLPDMILRLNLKKRGSIKTERKKRVEWIDIAKGFAMILVVIGHTAFSTSKQEILRAMIFSFHMPLFFILSGMTLSFADNWKQLMNKTVKDVKNLLIPYVVCYILSTIIGLFFAPSNITNKYYFTANLLGFIYASGVPTTFGTYEVFSAGAIWFFVFVLRPPAFAPSFSSDKKQSVKNYYLGFIVFVWYLYRRKSILDFELRSGSDCSAVSDDWMFFE